MKIKQSKDNNDFKMFQITEKFALELLESSKLSETPESF